VTQVGNYGTAHKMNATTGSAIADGPRDACYVSWNLVNWTAVYEKSHLKRFAINRGVATAGDASTCALPCPPISKWQQTVCLWSWLLTS